MTKPGVAPYGSWKSPITSDLIVSASIGLGEPRIDGNSVYWVEGRPLERGRQVIVRRSTEGKTVDINPPPFNVRTRVHEYGGGAYVIADGVIYFANFADQRLYSVKISTAGPFGSANSDPVPLTPELDLRYADAVYDQVRNRLIAVREDHTVVGREATNTLVSIDQDGVAPGGRVLVAGNDFYATPRISPDGTRMAWLTWNHPNMPWDGTELWVGEFRADGTLGNTLRVAGGLNESIFQPEWSPDNVLHFVSDRSNWWNLYRLHDGGAEPLCEMEAEFGAPQWGFGMSTYGFEPSGNIICAYTQNGFWRLARLDPTSGKLTPFDIPYSDIRSVRVGQGCAVFIGASPSMPTAVVQLDLTSGQLDELRRSSDVVVDPGYVSLPEAIDYPTEQGRTAYAFYYPPKNRDYVAPAGERPPLLVKTHGGPTGATSAGFSLTIQFWTSHGFAVLDVNYGGSTGYGREYRQRLNGQWGIVDVDDVVNGALYLVRRGDVDGSRMAIDGGSAGGYTTLCALAFRNTFQAGASYYGVSDLEALARDTHKFESRYLDSIVGPYPDRQDVYAQRSPIHAVERIECPMILFQGMEDKVVPPNQAERIFEAVREKGLPVAYVPFEGEQHGFRRAENIKRSLDGEFYFYSRVFGFEPADTIEPVSVVNMRAL